jgi:hypothetical protein
MRDKLLFSHKHPPSLAWKEKSIEPGNSIHQPLYAITVLNSDKNRERNLVLELMYNQGCINKID